MGGGGSFMCFQETGRKKKGPHSLCVFVCGGSSIIVSSRERQYIGRREVWILWWKIAHARMMWMLEGLYLAIKRIHFVFVFS